MPKKTSIRGCYEYVRKSSIDSANFIYHSPTNLHSFLTNISNKFGWRFMIMCFCVYGISQGLGEGWFYPAQSYYYLDVLKISAIKAASYSVVTHTPWTIKPIYGILSDCFPILGYHRTVYTTVSSGIGTISWICVAIFNIPVDMMVILLLFFGNFSLACPEVMIDAVVAERSKRYTEMASPLQSFNYGSLAFLAIFGTLSSGYLVTAFGPKALFGLVTITSFSVFVPSMLSYLGEGRKTYLWEERDDFAIDEESKHKKLLEMEDRNTTAILTEANQLNIPAIADDTTATVTDSDISRQRALSFRDDEIIYLQEPPVYKCNCYVSIPGKSSSTATTTTADKNNQSMISSPSTVTDKNNQCMITFEMYRKQNDFAKVGIAVSVLAIIVAATVASTQKIYIIAPITFSVTVIICLVLYKVLYQKYPVLVKATIFLFLRECLQPNVDTAFFYWYVDADDGPKFSAEFVGYINTMAYVAMLLGIVVYSVWLRHWTYRKIFTTVQIVLVFTNLLDLCLVTRLNLAIGIPDAVFILGDSTIGPVVKRLYLMPMYILASKLCPDGIEATIFSIMMSLSNFGYDVGTVFGNVLLTLFHVDEDHWSGFSEVLAIKSVMRLLPILLIPLLVPPGTPEDPPEVMLGRKSSKEKQSNNEDDKSNIDIANNDAFTISAIHNNEEEEQK